MTALATYLGPLDRPRFAWLHRPAPAAPTSAGGGALIIVPPFGYEAVCAHRSLRHLAEAAAAAGLRALRVDLDGTGDSAGDDLDPDRVDAWLATIDDAVDDARADGATHVVLAGVRLGAALAIRAATRRADVAAVVAIAPVVSGKRYLREARLLQAALGLDPAPGLPTAGAAGAAVADDVDEVVGFALTAATRAAIGAIDLTAAPTAPPAVLVIDRDDLPPSEGWLAHLRHLGAAVEHARLPGYVEMVLDPHKAVVPTAILAATVAFARRAWPSPAAPPPAAHHRRDHAVVAPGVIERPLTLPAGLRGIVSAPTVGTPRRVVILLNAGAVARIGPNRLHVVLARQLAARGDRVLRLDLSGLGDSPARPGAPEHVVYGDHALADVDIAVAWARDQGVRHVAVVGLCSGAYHAFKAAVDGTAVDDAVMINPLTFFWTPDMPLDVAPAVIADEAARLGKRAHSLEAWRKLLRGQVDPRRVAKVLLRRARGLAADRVRDLARHLRVPLRDDLGSELLAIARRHIAMTFVLANSDPGYTLLTEGGGYLVDKLRRRGALHLDRIEGPDHTFTARWTHPIFLAHITAALDRGSAR